jgi:hypothetical protein
MHKLDSPLNKNTKQPLFYSLLGFGILFSSVLFVFQGNYIANSNPFLFSKMPAIDFFIRHFTFWKIYTLSAFMLGLSSFYNKSRKINNLIAVLTLLLPLLTVLVLALFNSLFFALIPLILLHYCMLFFKEIGSVQIILISSLSIFLALITVSFFGVPDLHQAAFFATIKPFAGFNSENQIAFNYLNPDFVFTWFYGFSILFLGYWIGKKQWFLNYPFFYNELKTLFKLCVGLLILWLTLNFFDAYQLITKWRAGQIFYLADAMAVQLISVYIFIFILIYLENFILGKKILSMLGLIGKNWPINIIVTAIPLIIPTTVNTIGIPLLFLAWLFIILVLSKITQRVTQAHNKESF